MQIVGFLIRRPICILYLYFILVFVFYSTVNEVFACRVFALGKSIYYTKTVIVANLLLVFDFIENDLKEKLNELGKLLRKF